MVTVTKAALRRTALARRAALSPAETTRRSALLMEHLFANFPVAEWRWLHVFLPLVRQNEPDTWLIVRRVWADALPVRLAAPVVQPDGVSLRHYELTAATPLRANRWGILEPAPTPPAEVQPAALDAVLVPLLALDAAGHRVGYGGGFYDRFLAQCRPGCQLIGLQLLAEKPVAAIADVQPTDVRLSACLTPGGVVRFQAARG